ncbi:MAG: hypothetical protein RIS70_4260 [Planctomycetota bacterium]|jgi:hypothetical protein
MRFGHRIDSGWAAQGLKLPGVEAVFPFSRRNALPSSRSPKEFAGDANKSRSVANDLLYLFVGCIEPGGKNYPYSHHIPRPAMTQRCTGHAKPKHGVSAPIARAF